MSSWCHQPQESLWSPRNPTAWVSSAGFCFLFAAWFKHVRMLVQFSLIWIANVTLGMFRCSPESSLVSSVSEVTCQVCQFYTWTLCARGSHSAWGSGPWEAQSSTCPMERMWNPSDFTLRQPTRVEFGTQRGGFWRVSSHVISCNLLLFTFIYLFLIVSYSFF